MQKPEKMLMVSLCLLTAGCVSGPIKAPSGSVLTVPEGVQLGWNSGVNGQFDGFGAVIPLDVHVDDSDGDPLERIEVEILSGYGGVYIIPEQAVKAVDYPNTPSDVNSQQDVYDLCVDDNGNFSNEDEWCAWYWDTESATYVQLGMDYAGGDENYAPTYMIGQTDGHGNLRFYVYVDTLPQSEEGAFAAVAIMVTIATGGDRFDVGPNVGG